jgi:hypothetical protein
MAAKVSKIEANVIDDKLLCEGLIIDKNLTEAEKAAGTLESMLKIPKNRAYRRAADNLLKAEKADELKLKDPE